MKNNTLDEIAKVLLSGENIYIFPHIIMDGDAIGSAGALCQALRNVGKNAYVITEDALAENLKFLDRGYIVDYNNLNPAKNYISVCVDCSETGRFPARKKLFSECNISVCIDHHKTAEPICSYNYIDPNAAATAEIIYELIKAMNIEITESIADSIFAAITTDTGNFQYSNTTAKTHSTVLELYNVKKGFNDVSINLYENESFTKLALQSDIMNSAKLIADGQAVVAYVSQEMLKKHSANMNDSEGVASKLRSIKGVEIAVLLRENEDGTVKASMRSKSYADVASICIKHGGGGHTKAAGFTEAVSIETLTELLTEEIKNLLNK